MRMTFRFSIHALAGLLCIGVVVPAASAGCGDTSTLQPPFQFVQSRVGAPALLRGSAGSAGSASTAATADASVNATVNTANPVGMWNIQFISQGNTAHTPSIPDGALIDFGYAQWHTDGTEIMNSGAHAPATQNFCLGVWVRTGYFTYEVNHFALSYDATSGALAANVNVREQITLDPSGNEFSGTFTINIYNPTSGQQVDHLAGNIAATRVTVDQTIP